MSRMKSRRTLAVCAALIVSFLVAFGVPISQIARATDNVWGIVSSPNAGSSDNSLQGVATKDLNTAVAVGSHYDTTSSAYLPTILQWDGTAWSVVSSPAVSSTAELYGVTAVPGSPTYTNQFWAVGYKYASSRTLDSDGLTYDVSGSQCLIEHSTDNGASWSTVSCPSPTISTTTAVLQSVSAYSASDVWAAGYYIDPNENSGLQQALILHYDGSSWTRNTSVPQVSGWYNTLYSVYARAGGDAWADGRITSTSNVRDTRIVHWDGSSWNASTSPNPSPVDLQYLFGITAFDGSHAWASGAYFPDLNGKVTLIESWNGTSWSKDNTPNVPNTIGDVLFSVSPVSSSDVWSVGSYKTDTAYSDRTLIEHWNGSAWSIVTSPNQGTSQNELRSVSVVPGTGVGCNTGAVWAVGLYRYVPPIGGAVYKTLVEEYTIAASCGPQQK